MYYLLLAIVSTCNAGLCMVCSLFKALLEQKEEAELVEPGRVKCVQKLFSNWL